MTSKATWLFILAACACLGGHSLGVEPGPKVYVIQPDTDRRVCLAELSVRTESGQAVLMSRTTMRTGPYGEPVRPKDAVDPSYGTLVLEARKHDVTGRLEVTYDPDPYFWKQAYDAQEQVWKPDHGRGNWRPDVVCQWNLDPTDEEQERGRWSSQPYSEWKAAQVAAEQRRVGERQVTFITEANDKLIEAVAGGAIDEQSSEKIKAALEELLATDMKAPLDPTLNKAVTNAIEEAVAALEQQTKAGEQPADAPQPGDPGLKQRRPLSSARTLRDLQSRIRQGKDLQADLESALGYLIR